MLLQRVGDFIAELERVMFRTFGERSSSVVHTWEDDVLLSRPVSATEVPRQSLFKFINDGQWAMRKFGRFHQGVPNMHNDKLYITNI